MTPSRSSESTANSGAAPRSVWEGVGDGSDAASCGVRGSLSVETDAGGADRISLKVVYDDATLGELSATLHRTADAGRLGCSVVRHSRPQLGEGSEDRAVGNVEVHVATVNAASGATISTCAWCDVPWHTMLVPWLWAVVIAATAVFVIHAAVLHPRIAARYDGWRWNGTTGVLSSAAAWLGIVGLFAPLRLRRWTRGEAAPSSVRRSILALVVCVAAYGQCLGFSLAPLQSLTTMMSADPVELVEKQPLGSWRECGPTHAANVTMCHGYGHPGECACWVRYAAVGQNCSVPFK
jgi:hypothetical protein